MWHCWWFGRSGVFQLCERFCVLGGFVANNFTLEANEPDRKWSRNNLPERTAIRHSSEGLCQPEGWSLIPDRTLICIWATSGTCAMSARVRNVSYMRCMLWAWGPFLRMLGKFYCKRKTCRSKFVSRLQVPTTKVKPNPTTSDAL